MAWGSDKIIGQARSLPLSADKLAGLYEIGLTFASAKNLDELLERTVTNLSHLMEAERSTIYFFDQNENHLWSKVAQGIESQKITLSLGSGIAGSAALGTEPLIIEDAHKDPRFNPEIDKKSGFFTRNILCISFYSSIDQRLLGVTQVLNKKGGNFNHEDIQLLKAINNQISLTCENHNLIYNLQKRNTILSQTQEELKNSLNQLEIYYAIERISNAPKEKLEESIREGLFKVLSGFKLANIIAEFSPNQLRLPPEILISLGGLQSSQFQTFLLESDEFNFGQIKVSISKKPNFLENPEDPTFISFQRIIDILSKTLSSILNRNLKEEQDRMAQVGQTFSKLVHDLKSPLGIIQGYNALLDEEEDRELRTEYCQTIGRQIEHINDLTEGVLQFSRGQVSLLKRKVNINSFFKDFIKDIKAYTLFENLELDFDIQYKDKLTIDENKIKSCLLNLLKNSAEALNGEGKILLTCKESKNGSIIFEVSDNGPGIPDEIKPYIFENFVSHGKEDGTGIGLAIVKRIIEDHSGKILVESSIGQGTEFTISLPKG